MWIFFTFCAEEAGQRTGNAISSSDHLAASWNQRIDLQHLREREVEVSDVMFRFIIRNEDVRIELLAVRLKAVDAVCQQAWPKGSRGGGKLFVEGPVGEIEGHDVFPCKLEFFFGWAAPDASEGGVAAFACCEASDNDGEREDVTNLNVAKHSMLLYVFCEIYKTGTGHVLCVEVLRAKTAPDD